MINMDNNHIVSKIHKNATDVESDSNNSKNYTTATNNVYKYDCGDSFNIEYSNLKPSDQHNYFISYRDPDSNRGKLLQMINNSNDFRIHPGFENTYRVQNSNINSIVTTHGTNNTVPREIISFEVSGIHKDLMVNISKLNYKIKTKILKYTLPIIMGGRDLLASTPAGSGKTIAFVISILNCLLNNLPEINDEIRRCEPLAVIVVPKKKSVKKIYNFISQLSSGTSIICKPLYAIESAQRHKHKIKQGVHVIVATPESLASFVSGGSVTFAALRLIVFNEVDLILQWGFKPEIEFILNNKTMVSVDKRLTALSSTNMPDDVKQLAMTYLRSNYVSLSTVPISRLVLGSWPQSPMCVKNRPASLSPGWVTAWMFSDESLSTTY